MIVYKFEKDTHIRWLWVFLNLDLCMAKSNTHVN